jgi:hypothetical protein
MKENKTKRECVIKKEVVCWIKNIEDGVGF